jgi:NAD(P)-dependent dehydrogenase (short-subunit alcohol dehydrogenase family)
LLAAFQYAERVDVAVANAGVSEEADYFADTFDEAGALVEPAYGVLDVNLRGVLNFTKLAISSMRRLHVSGSIVITSSATAYSPEHSLPVYSAAKLAVSVSVSEAVFLSLLLAVDYSAFFLLTSP